MIAKRTDPWLSATLLVVSVGALGRAMHVGDGILKPGTMPWFAVAFIAAFAAVLIPVPGSGKSYGRIELVVAMLLILGWQIAQLISRVPFNEVGPSDPWFSRFRWGIGAAALLTGATLLARGWVRHVAFAALLVTHFLIGTSVIRASPAPHIDVFVFQRDASSALVRGQNPYELTFPDILGPTWYGPGIASDGRLNFGYPYMPLTLMLAAPGQMVAGDYRFSQLAAITLSAALIAYSRPGLVSFAGAAILLLQPRGMYIVERGWSDPFVLLPLAGAVFCAVRLPRAAPWIMGLFFASKQYVPLAGCAALLVVGRASLLSKAVLAAAAVTLPVVLWNVEAFWQSAVVLQFRQPFRWDSLSFVAAWMQGDRQLPGMALALPFIAVGAASSLVMWRCRKTPAGFAAGTALILFAFFAFNKQAFGNYYYVVIGAMCCAIATGAAEGGA